jgi:hypothetical protein
MSVLYLQARVKPLQLIHYTGSDKLAEVMDICPKLRYCTLIMKYTLYQALKCGCCYIM